MNNSFLFDFIRNLYADFSFQKESGKVRMPLRYILELTYRCNLRCPFCYITDRSRKNELSKNEWFDIIDQIPPFSLISFVAGEVLLKENFIDIFKKASEKHRKVTLITNGILLNEEIVDVITTNNILLLSVSLDGIGEHHDKIRNYKNLYEIVMSNIDLYNTKRKKFEMLDIKTCILEENLDDIPLLYKQASKLNADFFSLTFIRKQTLRQNSILFDDFSEEFYKNNYPIELYFDMEHFKEIYKELEYLQKKSKTIVRYAPRFNSIGDIDKIEKFFSMKDADIKTIYKPCKIPMSGIYITPYGDVYPCLSYKVANLKEMPLRESINTCKFRTFRKNLNDSKIFNACQMCCDAIVKNL